MNKRNIRRAMTDQYREGVAPLSIRRMALALLAVAVIVGGRVLGAW